MSERQVDLGLGQGLKPGALSISKDGDEDNVKELPSKFFWRTFLEEKRARKRSMSGVIDVAKAVLPVSAEGTVQHLGASKALDTSLQLDSTKQEVEVLRQELESYRKQLDSKHTAIRILRQQMVATGAQLDELNHRHVNMQRDMTTEINRLQFELEYNQNILMESQQRWSQRFDRVCQENIKQQSSLNARSDELRQLTEERKALVRDREELLALLDVDKRQQWSASASSIAVRAAAAVGPSCQCNTQAEDRPEAENSRSSVSSSSGLSYDADDGGCSAIDIAVLGACSCPGGPCRCAQAAARLKREVVSAREAAAEARQRAEDAYVVVDAYRNAFEEQLSRNRSLTLRMSELATGSGSSSSHVTRLKALVAWVGRQLHELGVSSSRDGPGDNRQSVNIGNCFSMRRASTVEDLGLASAACHAGTSLSASSWSISESVVSAGLLGSSAEPCEDSSHVECKDQGGRGSPREAQKEFTTDTSTRAPPELDETELMALLLEKLCERTESVAHQRITARVLKRPGAATHGGRPSRTAASASSGVFSSASSEVAPS